MTAQPRAITSPLLKPIEAAAYLRMSRGWVWLHRVELGVILVGSKMRYTQAGLDAYLLRQQQHSPSKTLPVQLQQIRESKRPALDHDTPTNPLTGLPWGEYETHAPQQQHAASGGRGGRE